MSDISDALGLGSDGFDPSSVPAAEGFDPLPAGWYTVTLDKVEVKSTKKGDGKRLWMEAGIVDEQFKGRKLFPAINLSNPNQKTVEIGMAELSGLAGACGLARITDSSELIGKVISVKVKIKEDPGYAPSNDVCGYKSVGGTPGVKKTVNVPAQNNDHGTSVPPVQKPPASGKRPWQK